MTKKNIERIINYSIGITGIILSVYFYYDSLKEREPTFIVDPIVSTIVDKELHYCPTKIFKGRPF